jgi:hypothetical protein
MTFHDEVEKAELFRQKSKDTNLALFNASGTAGANPVKLAQMLAVFDFNIGLLGWQNKPLANLSRFLVNYQASIDAKFHNDYKDVLVAEEIDKKRAERKGISIL